MSPTTLRPTPGGPSPSHRCRLAAAQQCGPSGSSGDQESPLALADGAAYDPVTDTWRPIVDGFAHPGFVPVWTGTQLVLFAKGGAVVYDPATDRWIDTCCNDTGGGSGGTPVWTGSTIVLLGSHDTTVGGSTFSPKESGREPTTAVSTASTSVETDPPTTATTTTPRVNPDEPILIIAPPSEIGMDGIVTGTLIERDGCLYVSDEAGAGLGVALFADGTSWDPTTTSVVDRNGTSVAIGESLHAGGGAYDIDAIASDELASALKQCGEPANTTLVYSVTSFISPE